MKTIVFALVGLGVVAGLNADVLTWKSDPASAVWNATDLNWTNAGGEAVAWDAVHNAVFGESSVKTIAVEGEVPASNMTFTVDGYTLGGTGTFMMDYPTKDSFPTWPFTVAAGTTARITSSIYGQNPPSDGRVNGILLKQGEGVLQLAGTTSVLRLHGSEGVVDLTDGVLNTAKLRASRGNNSCTLRVDRTRINVSWKSNNGILVGDEATFSAAVIGAGPLTFWGPDYYGMYEVVQSFSTAPGVETDGGIVKEGVAGMLLTGHNTFNGGVRVNNGQLRINNDMALGTGDTVLKTASTSLITYGQNVSPASRIVQNAGAFVASLDGAQDALTLTSVGVTENNADGVFTIGRGDNAFSRACLSLTRADSEPIGSFALRGNLDFLIDGGVLMARPTSASPFFVTKDFSVTNAPVAKVGPGGFIFDANGSTTDLGIPLDMYGYRVTNSTDCAEAFTNPDFEEGSVVGSAPAGWTIKVGVNESTGGRQPNSSAFTKDDPAYQTTNGSYYVALRRESTLTTTFTVPKDGVYRLSFEMGCRIQSNYQTSNITVTVAIDDAYQYAIGPRPKHVFKRFATDFYALTAGAHTMVVSTDDGSPIVNDTVFLDAFRLEHILIPGTPRIEKRGVGQLGVLGLSTDGEVQVAAGTLMLQKPDLDGAAITVADGATLSLVGGCVSNATVAVPAAGTLAFSDAALGANLVKNGSFETDRIVGDGRGFQAGANKWTFTNVGMKHSDVSGVQTNGSAMSTSGPFTSHGSQTVYLRNGNMMSQDVFVPTAGTYRISFWQASRHYGKSETLGLSVLVGETTVLSNAAKSASYGFYRSEVGIELEPGLHTLAFLVSWESATQPGDLLLLDDIRLERLHTGLTAVGGTTFNLTSGATVDVATSETLLLDAVNVDGKSVRGGVSALRAAGVTVTGGGDVQIGPPVGTLIIFR